MSAYVTKMRNFLHHESEITSVKFGLIATSASLAIVVAVKVVGSWS